MTYLGRPSSGLRIGLTTNCRRRRSNGRGIAWRKRSRPDHRVRVFALKSSGLGKQPEAIAAPGSPLMPETTRPVSVRLAIREVERLQTRAHLVSGTVAGIARELIVTGLAGGDNKALADRLMLIERRLVVLEAHARDGAERSERIEALARDLRAKFDALLNVLSAGDGAAR